MYKNDTIQNHFWNYYNLFGNLKNKYKYYLAGRLWS